VFLKYSAYLIFTTIIAIIAFALERVIESMPLADGFTSSCEYIVTNKAVFSYIDLYCEIERINRDLIQQLANSQSGLLSQFDQTQKKVNYVSEHIDSYIQWQTAECQKLLEERNKLEQFFSDLGLQANQLSFTFAEYEKRLNNSTDALLYCKKGRMLIEDINESFVSRYKQTSGEFIKRLEDTEQQLRKVVDQYSLFKEHMRPYSEKIDVYGYRMESAIQSFQNTSDLKQAVLENTSNEITKTLEEINGKMGKTLNDVDQFLRKNSFVLSKILETYRTNATTNREFKKILQSWPSLSPTEGTKE
jgi:ABC-type transporter Mla subunit MlaD